MSRQGQKSILNLSALSSTLLAEQEVSQRARALARFVAKSFPETAVSVYTLVSDDVSSFWIPRATVGEATPHASSIEANFGFLGRLMVDPTALVRTGAALKREDYPHVDVRRSLQSLCYLPLLYGQTLIGALEILSFKEVLTDDVVEALRSACDLGAVAIVAAQTYEEERHGSLKSITRLTQLYDLEKVFSSTLEMAEFLPLITAKFREILEAEAVNPWMLLPDETIELMHQEGNDPTAFKGQILKPNEGLAGAVSDTGESVCISNAADARLV